MTQKRTFKVLAAMSKYDGSGEWFMRVGSGFENRDGSLNVFLDAIPCGQRNVKLQIRELDAREIAQREAYRAATHAQPAGSSPGASSTAAGAPVPGVPVPGGSANESLPF